jgi:hypothetical protein
MATHPIEAPPGARVFNFLYFSPDICDLSEDLALVELPNGVMIDAGWFPAADPSGECVIRACRGRTVLARETTRDLGEAAKTVSALAMLFGRHATSPP